MRDLLNPADSLTVALKESEVDVTDNHEHRLVFYTDGRKIQKSKDNTSEELAAKWDDNRLVAEEKGSSGRKITRTYEIDPTGHYLYETVQMEGGRSRQPLSFRFVYDYVVPDEKP